MAIREIRKQKDEILYIRSKEVDKIDSKLKEVVQDMLDTMYKYDGIGLAACQVGSLKRIIVYDIEYINENANKKPVVLFNPVIIKKSKKYVTTEEGCLSFPDLYGKVDRPDCITVEAFDIDFNKIKINAKGIESVVIQHELDHLDGKVFVDIAYDTYYGEKEQTKNDKKKKYKS